jgi:hypothetical protein
MKWATKLCPCTRDDEEEEEELEEDRGAISLKCGHAVRVR